MPPTYPRTFLWSTLEGEYRSLLEAGYSLVTCADFAGFTGGGLPRRVVVNRVDVDFSLVKLDRLLDVFARLKVRASFFVRLHAPEYNPYSPEGLRLIRRIVADGHELGYHSEIVDCGAIWGEDPAVCLRRAVAVLETLSGVKVCGIASHGGRTGLNNLDFWKDHRAADFGLLYEAYDEEPGFGLFRRSFYISDSEWVRWKCYDRGVLRAGDHRSPSQHARDGHDLIYLLIHPDTYYDRHAYE